jgi:hypothetical protein
MSPFDQISPAEGDLPTSFTNICEKPLISADSNGNYNYSYINEWNSRFLPADKTEIDSPGVSAELIHPHPLNNSESFYVNNGIFIFSVVLLFVFAGIRIFYTKALWGLGKALLNYQWALKAYEEKNSLLQRVYFVLDIIFFLNATLAVYLISNYFLGSALHLNAYTQILFSAAFVGIIYFSRIIFIWFLAMLTKEGKRAGEFLMVTNVFYKATGIILFIPIIVFNYLSDNALPYISMATIALLLLSYIFTIIRGLYYSVKSKFYFYYYFLYLCAVEIMPLLLTTKIFMLTNGI